MKTNPLIKSENFYCGFDNDSTCNRGRIYFLGHHFGNFFTFGPDWGVNAGKIAFNREARAIDMNCPEIKPADSLEEILIQLEKWANTPVNKLIK